MDDTVIKQVILAALEPTMGKQAVVCGLEAPPSVEIEEFCTCPECGCTLAEVWNGSETRTADCPKCEAEFTPVLEGFKARIVSIVERRRRLRRGPSGQAVKAEAFRLLGK